MHRELAYFLMALLLLALPAAASRASESGEQAARAPKISVAALFKNKAALMIDGKRRVLSVGRESREGVKLLRSSSEEAEIEFAGQRQIVRLDGVIASRFSSTAAKSITLYPGRNGHYLVDGKINGHRVPFVLDTGATLVAISRNVARKLGLRYRVHGHKASIETAAGPTDAYYVSFDEITVRTLRFTRVPGVVIDRDYPSTALLGQSLLNRLDMHRAGLALELRQR